MFINNLALGDDAVVEELVALGADELVASAMAALPAESPALIHAINPIFHVHMIIILCTSPCA